MKGMDSESNKSVYGRFNMVGKGEEMNCRVVDMMKHRTLRWFDYLERMKRGYTRTK